MSHPTPIDSLDDPRVNPYRLLKDRDVARDGDRFIAEGELVVRRLLQSKYSAESVFVAQRRAEEIAPIVPDSVPLYVAPDELMYQVMGFKFHSGVIACGRRGKRTTLDDVIPNLPKRSTLMICQEVANTENLGGLMRIAAAFGMDALVLGEQSCDPFYRQAIRVSMGTAFSLNLVQSDKLMNDLARLQKDFGFELAATVIDASAEPLNAAGRGDRLAILFGNEAQGLPESMVRLCDRRITIPMSLGTDSLNVAVSAAVVLYHFRFSELPSSRK
jgi:tRNA G18 (ribose-2'-O)-methylase SpoU